MALLKAPKNTKNNKFVACLHAVSFMDSSSRKTAPGTGAEGCTDGFTWATPIRIDDQLIG
jgi:hypothetical protein